MHPFFKFIGVQDTGKTTTAVKKEKSIYTDEEIKIFVAEYNELIKDATPKNRTYEQKQRFFELKEILNK